ncbi:hypothetical protein [Prevotella histicola]|uniref:hypothetical protein n=1 Tax=Prevotella histicola TaxID=470565 RepID=UPI001CADA7BF|nr:hypothetical protein [Prevotella histicola]MBF1401229.1 hypothetical protein [Prevotella histicola]
MDKFTRTYAGTFYYEQAYLITISRPFPLKDKSQLHPIPDFAVISVTLPLLLTV